MLSSLVRNPKDFWAGLIYTFIGSGAVVIASDYGMGRALKMGPGYFPTFLGGVLTLIGVISLIRSFVTKGEPVGGFAVKVTILLIAATLLAGLLLRNAGIAIALPILVVISAYASIKFRWLPTLALAAGLTLFCIAVFIKGLSIPLPIIGRWLGG